jgi:hypothetical protein
VVLIGSRLLAIEVPRVAARCMLAGIEQERRRSPWVPVGIVRHMPQDRPPTQEVTAVLVGPVLVEIVSCPTLQRFRVIQFGRRRSFFLIPGVGRRN